MDMLTVFECLSFNHFKQKGRKQKDNIKTEQGRSEQVTAKQDTVGQERAEQKYNRTKQHGCFSNCIEVDLE